MQEATEAKQSDPYRAYDLMPRFTLLFLGLFLSPTATLPNSTPHQTAVAPPRSPATGNPPNHWRRLAH